MSNLRRWQLTTAQPHLLTLAADARLSVTDYLDDQSWALRLGQGEAPALALQTRYGGRVGLASLVPMWTLDNRTIYQAQAYAQPPVISTFAPGFIQAQARLTPQIALQADFWAIESHIVAGRFALANTGAKAITLTFDLFGHVGAQGRELSLNIVTLDDGTRALHLGQIGRINPVVLVENSDSPADPSSGRIGRTLTLEPNSKAQLRWIHVGLPGIYASIKLAQHWLDQHWQPHLKKLAQATDALPRIETGDEATDFAIALSYQQLMQAFLRPTSSLPHASFVATRRSDRGWSRRGDGTDHIRAWNGQDLPNAYLTALAVAPVNAALAQGIIRNYLAVQQPDGWIDAKPGLSGQKAHVLAMPVLARLTWGIFQYTEDATFLREALPALLRFFDRWFADDVDRDSDGLPEWQAEVQTGYVSTPTFSVGLPWGQQLDIATVEAPDLMAYLLSEAISLHAIAYYLHEDTTAQQLRTRMQLIQSALSELWYDDGYSYRDRDTHESQPGVVVLDNGAGDEEHFPALELDPASRLIVRVTGGVDQAPNLTLHLEGTGLDGQPITETAPVEAFFWSHGRGVYTSQNVFAQIDRIACDGLIRLYRIHAETPDLTRRDISAVLPLWAVRLPPEHIVALIDEVTDEQHFWQPNGVTMCSAADPDYDDANTNGSGGVRPFWLTLMGEGLIEAGRTDLATELLRRLLDTQIRVLKDTETFSEYYHASEPQGLGESGHLAGIVPLHLLLRVLGVRIVSRTKVWTGGSFHWGSPVTVTQHGVTVRRSDEGTTVQFASGRTVELAPDAPWQAVRDQPT